APDAALRDSIAVLDAYFAFCNGDRGEMLEAARRVNTAEDDDVEDLYLVQLALDEGGDHGAAAVLRAQIIAKAPTTVLTPVLLAWLRSDEAAVHKFSPRYPTAGP